MVVPDYVFSFTECEITIYTNKKTLCQLRVDQMLCLGENQFSPLLFDILSYAVVGTFLISILEFFWLRSGVFLIKEVSVIATFLQNL